MKPSGWLNTKSTSISYLRQFGTEVYGNKIKSSGHVTHWRSVFHLTTMFFDTLFWSPEILKSMICAKKIKYFLSTEKISYRECWFKFTWADAYTKLYVKQQKNFKYGAKKQCLVLCIRTIDCHYWLKLIVLSFS